MRQVGFSIVPQIKSSFQLEFLPLDYIKIGFVQCSEYLVDKDN